MISLLPYAGLGGVVDLHVHGSPDIAPRKYSDIQLAQRAKDSGMAAIVLKSHVESTVGRAALASEATGFPVFGGLVLNPFVAGGLNADAVEVSLALGARVIWLASLGSRAHQRSFAPAGSRWTEVRDHPASPPVSAAASSQHLGTRGALTQLREVVRRPRQSDALLATGHAGADEIGLIATAAQKAGTRLLLTHPDYVVPRLTRGRQIELAQSFSNVFFERAAYVTSPAGPKSSSIAQMVEAMVATGIARNVLSSDLGQPANPPYPDGLEGFFRSLLAEGVAEPDIRTMSVDLPKSLLGMS